MNKNRIVGKLLSVGVAGLLLCGFSSIASAVPVTGSITFGGTVRLNGTPATATQVTSWSGFNGAGAPFVTTSSGSFSGIPASTIASFASPWNFNSGAVTGFWSVGGFVFNLSFSSIVAQGPGFVAVSGMGVITGNGFTPTSGTWTFTANDPSSGGPNPAFTFSAGTQAIPDGGATVCLLGLGLAGVETLRRKFRKR